MPAPPSTYIPNKTGRKPRASLRRLSAAIFDLLTRDIMHMRAPARLQAARLHLVDGLTMVEASWRTGVPTNNLENARKSIMDKHDLLAKAYAPKGSDYGPEGTP